MREEIDTWVEEGRNEPQSDLPLVLIDVDGVVRDTSKPDPAELEGEESGDDPDDFPIPDYMPDLIRHLVQVADVWWSIAPDEELQAELADRLGLEALQIVGTDEFGMTEPAVRARLWKAASVGRATYRIEHLGGEVPPRIPDSTVLVDTASLSVLHPDDLPSELRPR